MELTGCSRHTSAGIEQSSSGRGCCGKGKLNLGLDNVKLTDVGEEKRKKLWGLLGKEKRTEWGKKE